LVPVAAGLVAAATSIATIAGSAPAFGSAAASGAAASKATGPTMRLIRTQRVVTAGRFGKQVVLDPGIWVAVLGSPLQIDVSRPSYSGPLRAVQLIRTPRGIERRPLPHSMLERWRGLRHFLRLTIRNKQGKVVASRLLTFCPNGFNVQRTGPNSAQRSIYPQQCGAGDPFPLGEVWGLAKGWAADPANGFGFFPGGGTSFRLRLGTYRLDENITDEYGRRFNIPMRQRSTTVTLHVVKSKGCCNPVICCPRGAPARESKALPSLPHNVPLLSRVPASALPDLRPLPSWGISTSTIKKTHQDFLNFAATVWVGGGSPLDVEGFRRPNSPVMNAYQYFWRNGRIVGRARAGTMGFDSKKGHNHWHFEQFARYVLLKADKNVAVRSQKVGFCIAPTDSVDMLLHHAQWNPSFIGLNGACGSTTALWVQEYMPVGWGDTYNQSKAGQAFNITSLPNGTYYIEIIANPEHVLHEVTMSNDTSLRKVIISGTPGHRHVTVPAWHGIDPEG
jgi:hypothetical protein